MLTFDQLKLKMIKSGELGDRVMESLEKVKATLTDSNNTLNEYWNAQKQISLDPNITTAKTLLKAFFPYHYSNSMSFLVKDVQLLDGCLSFKFNIIMNKLTKDQFEDCLDILSQRSAQIIKKGKEEDESKGFIIGKITCDNN
jgi:hypothetical protein